MRGLFPTDVEEVHGVIWNMDRACLPLLRDCPLSCRIEWIVRAEFVPILSTVVDCVAQIPTMLHLEISKEGADRSRIKIIDGQGRGRLVGTKPARK
ncbi:hypothetical protein A6X20_41575 [Bradyrhizobium elkanii]|nr:hypothetical protein A6X20_41575 [Bradyrhizobium elkanii]ODM72175.1 hypothetical protein A6452_41470 [Bradyrhizobium elkanii]